MSDSSPSLSRLMLVLIAILIGIIVALVAGILATVAGLVLAAAMWAGGVAFGGTLTLALLVEKALDLI